MVIYRRLLPEAPWRDEDADPMPITTDQVDVLMSWGHRLRSALRDAQGIDDVVDAYGHLMGACTDVEVEIMGVLRAHEQSDTDPELV